jgi:hypothetical protein
MTRSAWTIVLLLVPIAQLTCKGTIVVDNEQYLKEARVRAKKFEQTLEPEQLKESYAALENVYLPDAPDPQTRRRLRGRCLEVWLQLIQLVDQSLDPNFDPDDVPERTVAPPPTAQGGADRPGVDPAKIRDPQARAAYEAAIAANREKARNYRLQVHLRRLDERITERAKSFIRDAYTPASEDRTELRNGIENTLKDRRRKADFLELLAPRR